MFQLDAYGTLVAASLVLLLGRQCVHNIPLLKNMPSLTPLLEACWLP